METMIKGQLPVILTQTSIGTPMVLGVITADVLRDTYSIPRRDSRTKQGYQREISVSRVNRLARDLREHRVDLPTAVLLNLREYEPKRHLALVDGSHHTLTITGEDRLQVVDGQHRVEALARLMDEDEERWAEFRLPFVSMLGASLQEEIRQFYVVNSTAKSVRTDLALDLLKQRAETEPGVRESLIETGETWKVKGQMLTEELEKTSIWKGRIRFPGDAAAGSTIRSSGMVASLKLILGTPYFGALSTEKQLAILDAYWRGIKKVLPEIWEDPTDYVIVKSTGVMVMHALLVSVIEYLRSTGRSLLDPEPFADVLRDALTDLEGDTSSNDVARGAEFWLAGPDGAAGSYSSNAGRRVLLAKLRGSLPELEVE